MSEQMALFRRPAKHGTPMRSRRFGVAFDRPARGGAASADYPGISLEKPDESRRTVVSGSVAAALHAGALALLIFLASLAPQVEELIPVQLLKEKTPQKEKPAAAPKALAERRFATFAPAVQSVQPQVINPRVIAEAAPAVSAKALDMDAVSSVAAPTQISRSATVVEHVSAVNSIVSARA